MTRLREKSASISIEGYPRTFQVRALYSDMDAFRHINNIAIARWFEEARAAVNMEVFGRSAMVDPGRQQLLIASAHFDYLDQVSYPSEVTVASGVGQVGRSSYVLSHALFSAGSCAALAETVMVKAYDGRPNVLDDTERARLEALRVA